MNCRITGQRAWTGAIFAMVGLMGLATLAQGQAANWPQWRGPNRDGKSAETGLLKQWPEGGPKLLWAAENLGAGYTQPIIVDGTIYITGGKDNAGLISALDMDGKLLWQKPYSQEPWDQRGKYKSTRSIPTFDRGLLFLTSTGGWVYCLDAKTGEKKWEVDAQKRFNGEYHEWAYTESPLVVGDKVICTPGGKESSVAALNRETGETVWTCKGIGEISAYCSPILVQRGGMQIIITMTGESVVGINAADGTLLWKHPHKTRYPINPFTPVYEDGMIFACSWYGFGGQGIELSEDGKSVKEIWADKMQDNNHGGAILLDGYLYASNGKDNWFCSQLKTGKVLWEQKGVGKGSVCYADGMLYTYGEKGQVALVKASAEKYEQAGTFTVTKGKGQAAEHWPHPVVCGGRLYIRFGDTLMAYDVKAPQ